MVLPNIKKMLITRNKNMRMGMYKKFRNEISDVKKQHKISIYLIVILVFKIKYLYM